MKTQIRGKIGEDAAAKYLKKKGYTILERNFRKRFGELDIIAQKENKIVFAEVKTRSSTAFGMPSEYVNLKKQQKIIKTAQSYLSEKNLDPEISFDVFEVIISGLKVISLNHIENAFYS